MSEKLIIDIRMEGQFLEAFRKEFAMVFAGGILKIEPYSEFHKWKQVHNKDYRPMPSRGHLDIESRLPAVEAAVRLAPNGSFEDIDSRERTGFLRASRRASPTARGY